MGGEEDFCDIDGSKARLLIENSSLASEDPWCKCVLSLRHSPGYNWAIVRL